MTDTVTHEAGQTAAERPGPYAEILAAAREARSAVEFFRRALRHVGTFFTSPYATLYLRMPAEVIEEDFHCGPTDPGFWKPAVQRHLTETLADQRPRARLLSDRNARVRVMLLSVPLCCPQGTPLGALALVTRATDDDARIPASLLQSLAALTSYASGFVGHQRGADAGGSGGNPADSQALARAAVMESAEELAYSITNSLRNKLGCDQVALGQEVRRGIRLLSISGLDEIRPRSPGVVALRAAMEESLDADRPIRFDSQLRREGDGRQFRLHRQWHEVSNGLAVASLPLTSDNDCRAVLSLRRAGDQPFTEEELAQIHERVLPYLPALLLLQAAHRTVLGRIRDNLTAEIRRLTRPGHIVRKITAVALGLATLWVCFGTLTYTVTAPCQVAPREGRQVAMPFDGTIRTAEVVPGDEVRAGDVLCRLDVRDLELRRAELLAERDRVDLQHLQGLAGDAPEQARLAAVQQRALSARLALLDRQIEQAVLRSPIDGVVLAGDLRSQVGSVVPLGTPLFELAPPAALRLEIEVPQEQAAGVVAGLSGSFLSHAQPETSRAFRLVRVAPSADQVDDHNVFRVEADAELGDWMRPGMEGFARIEVGPRPTWWVLFHRFTDPLRLNFWL